MSEQKGKKQGWLGRLIGKKQADDSLPDGAVSPGVQEHPAIAELALINAKAAAEMADAVSAAADSPEDSGDSILAVDADATEPAAADNTSPVEGSVALEKAGSEPVATPIAAAALVAAGAIVVPDENPVGSATTSEAEGDVEDVLAPEESAPHPTVEPAAEIAPSPSPSKPASPPAAHLIAFGGETLEEDDAAPTEEKSGWFTRIRKGLSRSSHKISDGIADFMIRQKLDDEALDEMEDLLITSDLGVKSAALMSKKLSRHRFAANVSATMIKEELAEEIAAILSPFAAPLIVDTTKKPHVILVVGVNGSGKTTTIGKLAKYYRDHGLAVSLVAGDTFRAAAVEQLKVWGERAGCPVVSGMQGADAAGLAFDALASARKRGDDLVLIDTAGRLQNKTDLMAELDKIVRVIKKQDAGQPHDVLLVLDATVGQNAHSQVEHFKEITDVTGLIVTKLDGTARGGVVVALAERFGLPIHAIGIGEGADDLRPFRAKDFARSLVGLED